MKENVMKRNPWIFFLTLLTVGMLCQSTVMRTSRAALFNPSPTPSPTPELLNTAFIASENELRAAFDAAELRGEKKQGINAGNLQTTEVPAQNPSGQTETLKMRILFTTPVAEMALNGYSFGLVARQRTPADRKDFEDLWIRRGLANQSKAIFHVFLEEPTNPDATIPVIHFRLLDKQGNQIQPDDEPTSFVSEDLHDAIALER